MSRLDEINAKMCADKAYDAASQCGEYDPSLRAEAEQRVGYHRSQAEKHDQAAAFFRENPAFDQFIRLIRSGAIQI